MTNDSSGAINPGGVVKALGLLLLGFLAGLVVAHALGGGRAAPPPPRPAPAPAPAPRPVPMPVPRPRPAFPSTWFHRSFALDVSRLCGWIPDHPSRPAVAASVPLLSQAGPELVADPARDALLYKAWTEVFRGYPDYPAQKIGDCTSFASAHAHDLLETIEVLEKDLPVASVGRTCTEALYGLGREAAGMLGTPGDGCYNAALAKAMTSVGIVRYAELGPADGPPAYDGQRARAWGRDGVPTAIGLKAARHKLGAAARVDSIDAAIAALQAGHPLAVATRLGFELERDADGFCRRKGSWGHAMCCAGYRADQAGFLLLQSWGPDLPQGPTALDQPSWSFWISDVDMAAVLAEKDSFALSGSPGFAPRALPGALS